MSVQGLSLNTILVALILFSIYLGVQIDYRHWTWVVFLLVVPVALAAALLIHMRRGAREQRPAQDPK